MHKHGHALIDAWSKNSLFNICIGLMCTIPRNMDLTHMLSVGR